jgi:hypothetical protein
MSTPYAHDGPELAIAVERSSATIPNLEMLSPRPRRGLMDLGNHAVAVLNTDNYKRMPIGCGEHCARGVPTKVQMRDGGSVIARHDLGPFGHASPQRLVGLTRRLWDRAEVVARRRQSVLPHDSAQAVDVCWQEALGIAVRANIAGEAALAQ